MKYPVILKSIAVLLVCLAAAGGCAGRGSSSRDYNTVIEGTLTTIQPFTGHEVVDAIETLPEGMVWPGSVAGFRIDRVRLGEIEPVRRGGPSKMEQMKDAVKEKDVLGILTLDYENPDEMIEKKWFKVAVLDPWKTFGVSALEGTARPQFKLYLQQKNDDPHSYVLIRQERLS